MIGELYFHNETYWICISHGTVYSTFINFKLRDHTYSLSSNFSEDKKIAFDNNNVKIIFEKLLPKINFDDSLVIKNWKQLYDIYINFTFM